MLKYYWPKQRHGSYESLNLNNMYKTYNETLNEQKFSVKKKLFRHFLKYINIIRYLKNNCDLIIFKFFTSLRQKYIRIRCFILFEIFAHDKSQWNNGGEVRTSPLQSLDEITVVDIKRHRLFIFMIVLSGTRSVRLSNQS